MIFVTTALALASMCLLPGYAPGQEATPGEREEALREAVMARRDSADYREKLEALREAQEALEAEIAAIPDVAAIDEYVAQAMELVRQAQRQRQRIIEQKAQELEPLKAAVRRAQQELRDADAVAALRRSASEE